MSRFLCCLPLKSGVWFFSLLFFAWGTILTVIGWYGVARYNSSDLALTRFQQVSLIITTASWTLLPVFTIFGFGAILGRNYRFLSLYATLIWFQLGASIGAGAYFIYTLYRRGADGAFLSNCETRAITNQAACQNAFQVLRGVIVAVYIVIWLVQIWGGVTILQYAEERKRRFDVRFNDATPLPQPTLPVLNPLMMPAPEPPILQPAPPPRFGPRASPRNSPSNGPPPAFVSNAGGVSLPPPIPFDGGPAPSLLPPNTQLQPQYAFITPRNSYGGQPQQIV